ncbi:hypothetical protein BTHI11S_00323 [Bosea thiooxidans]
MTEAGAYCQIVLSRTETTSPDSGPLAFVMPTGISAIEKVALAIRKMSCDCSET